jgi:hypothetical protein
LAAETTLVGHAVGLRSLLEASVTPTEKRQVNTIDRRTLLKAPVNLVAPSYPTLIEHGWGL